MTFDEFLRQGDIRRHLHEYKNKRDKAVEITKLAFMTHGKAYVSVSGGKDSVVCAYIADAAARSVNRDFVMWAHISDASFPGTEETLQELSRRLGRELVVSRSEGSAFEAISSPQKASFGKTGVFFDSIRDFVKSGGYELCFTGVRAYESKRRMQAARAHGSVFRSRSGGDIWICNPVTWFRLEDVAAALVEFDAPIHPIYQKMAIGTSINAFGEDGFIRLGYITSRDLLTKGTVTFLRLNYPKEFAKLCQAWPEAKNYC